MNYWLSWFGNYDEHQEIEIYKIIRIDVIKHMLLKQKTTIAQAHTLKNNRKYNCLLLLVLCADHKLNSSLRAVPKDMWNQACTCAKTKICSAKLTANHDGGYAN